MRVHDSLIHCLRHGKCFLHWSFRRVLVQTDSLVYYGLGFEFSPVSFLSILCHGSRKFARVSKNNLATSFQEAPCRISMIGMESRI